MLLKYTEYEILSFLKYDDSFQSLIKKSSLQHNPRTQSLGIGINVQRFQVALANLDRLSDLFSIASKVVSGRPLKGSPTKMPLSKIKPLPLKNLKNTAKTPSKFTNLDELETFLKTAQSCSLGKENLSNILQIINYLKKKVYTYKKNHEQAERQYKKQKKILAEKAAAKE